MGQLLAYAAMKEGNEVSWMPSYGPEMRGGTANSMITVSNEPIASPIVTYPTTLIVMNKASVNKFAQRVKNNGLIIYNSSLIDEMPYTDGSIKIVAITADDIAVELGNVKLQIWLSSARICKKEAFLQLPRPLRHCLTSLPKDTIRCSI